LPNAASRLLETTAAKIFRTAAALYRPARHWIGAAALALFMLMTAAVVHVYPQADWDMIAYTANILEGDIEDPVELHERTFGIVKENITPGEYLTLTQDRPYRIRQAEDPAAFSTMLGFYRLKLLYVETAKLLTKYMNPVEALRLISVGSVLAIGAVLLVWLARNGALMHGPAVIALLVLSSFGATAGQQTPDLYTSVFLILAAFLYLEKQDLAAALALVAAFLVRPDHLAFIGVFFVFAALYGPGRWVMTSCFAVCFAIYIWLTRDATHPGWWVHMWFSHVEYVPTLEGFDPPFSIAVYLQMLVRNIVRSLINQTWLALLFAQVLFFAMVINPSRLSERVRVLLYGVFTSICAKFVVFPHYDTRFYLPYLVVMGMILLVAWNDQRQATADLRPA
jgi:hypothetical protein